MLDKKDNIDITLWNQAIDLLAKLSDELRNNCCQSLLEADELAEEIDDFLKKVSEND